MWGVISVSYQSRAPLEKVMMMMTSRTELWRVLLITRAFNISSLISEIRCFTATLCFNPLYALFALHDYHRPLCLQFKRACWTELMGPLTRIRVVSSTPSASLCFWSRDSLDVTSPTCDYDSQTWEDRGDSMNFIGTKRFIYQSIEADDISL